MLNRKLLVLFLFGIVVASAPLRGAKSDKDEEGDAPEPTLGLLKVIELIQSTTNKFQEAPPPGSGNQHITQKIDQFQTSMRTHEDPVRHMDGSECVAKKTLEGAPVTCNEPHAQLPNEAQEAYELRNTIGILLSPLKQEIEASQTSFQQNNTTSTRWLCIVCKSFAGVGLFTLGMFAKPIMQAGNDLYEVYKNNLEQCDDQTDDNAPTDGSVNCDIVNLEQKADSMETEIKSALVGA